MEIKGLVAPTGSFDKHALWLAAVFFGIHGQSSTAIALWHQNLQAARDCRRTPRARGARRVHSRSRNALKLLKSHAQRSRNRSPLLRSML